MLPSINLNGNAFPFERKASQLLEDEIQPALIAFIRIYPVDNDQYSTCNFESERMQLLPAFDKILPEQARIFQSIP